MRGYAIVAFMELLEDIRDYWEDGETVPRKIGLVSLALLGSAAGIALIGGLIAFWVWLTFQLV